MNNCFCIPHTEYCGSRCSHAAASVTTATRFRHHH